MFAPSRFHHWHLHITKTAAVIIAIFGLYIGGYAALYRVSEYHSLHNKANAWLLHSHRHITFDVDIGRRVFPRPTIILRNVVLTETDGITPALRVGELRIGIAWHSLWSTVTLEKLVLNEAKGQLVRDAAGNWSIHDFWQTGAQHSALFNRILVKNSELMIRDAHLGSVKLDQVQASLARTGDKLPYFVSAQAHAPFWQQLQLTASGVVDTTQGSLKLPDAELKFNGREHNYVFSGSLKTLAQWQRQKFSAENIRLEVVSQRYSSTLNGSISKLVSSSGETMLTGISTVLTTLDGMYRPNIALTAAQAKWQNGVLSSSELNVDMNVRDASGGNFDVSLKGDADWSPNRGGHVFSAKAITLYNPIQGRPRFVSEWEGALSAPAWNRWAISLHGLFDRQPAELFMQREGDEVSGSLKMAKWNITPYLEQGVLPSFRWFPPEPLRLKLDGKIGTLETPNAQVDNINAHILWDAKRVYISPLSANLYSGSTSGSLNIENRLPLSVHVLQNAKGVQIRPLMQDLFHINTISGKGTADFDLMLTGETRDAWLKSLSGEVKLDINDGEWSGINLTRLRQMLQSSNKNDTDELKQAMPFSHFVLSAKLKNGVSQHQIQARLVSPAAEMNSTGEIHFVQGVMREDMVFQRDGIDNMPLPIRLSGSMSNPTINLNYQKITSGLETPQQKQQAVSNTLRQQWRWLLQSD